MKTINLRIWLLTTALAASFTFYSCTEEEGIIQDEYEELSEDLVKKKKADKLRPSGDVSGITDSDAIEIALHSIPSKGILQLEKGTFYINRTIVAPEGFNGSVSGKGINKTTILGVGDIDSKFSVASPVTPTSFNYYPNECLFLFYNPDGNVSVDRLSMSIPINLETTGDYRHSLFAFISTILKDNEANTSFSYLKLTGKNLPYPDNESSPAVAIAVVGSDGEPVFGGTHTVDNCEISKIAVPPTAHSGFKNAKIVLKGNTCFDVRQTQLSGLVGCDISVKDNNITAIDISALNFFQSGFSIQGESNKVEIKNNFISSNSYLAIEINGPIEDGDADFEVVIKNNVLQNLGKQSLFGFPNVAVIGIIEGNENAIVKDNVLLGNAPFGILQQSDNGSFKNNDFSDFMADQSDYRLEGNNNELKGIGDSTVDDQGTGNIIKTEN